MPDRLMRYIVDPETRKERIQRAVTVFSVVLAVGCIAGLIAMTAYGETDHTQVVVAVIGLLGVVITAYIGYAQAAASRESLAQTEREMKFQSAALDFAAFITEWGDTMQDLEELMRDTVIDRFLILRAWNGYMEPRWTTAVLQVRQGNQKLISYVHYELDTDYIDRLRHICSSGRSKFRTNELPETAAIRKIYELEGIKSAIWYMLDQSVIPGSDSRAITYCSFAALTDDITDDVITRCSIVVGRMKGIVHAFK